MSLIKKLKEEVNEFKYELEKAKSVCRQVSHALKFIKPKKKK